MHPRTIRRHLSGGDIPGAEKVQGPHGETWTVGDDGLSVLRNKLAKTLEPLPTVEPVRVATVQADDSSDNARNDDSGTQLDVQQLGANGATLLALVEAVQASASAAAERERTASARESAAWQRTIDDQGDTIAHLRQLLESTDAALQLERAEVARLRAMLGLRTRATVPLRVVE